jgi:hypothetical protein
MGSLMAGWDSPVQDLKAEKLRRNNSLTREEIKAFWRSKEVIKEQHLSALSAHTEKMIQEDEFETGKQRRSSSVPRSLQGQGVQMKDTEKSESLEKIIQKNGWWNSSKWAFLNEPPVIGTEGPKYKYASQIHVASKPLNINTT